MLRKLFCAVVATLLGATACHSAPPSKDTVTDPQVAAKLPDFQTQGEYSGELKAEDGSQKTGVQVIALGDGKFDAVLYPGGLPGDGGKKSSRQKASGQRQDGVARLKGSEFSATIEDGTLTVYDPLGGRLGELKKVDRESPTLGKKAPQGALVLFDGESAENFPGAKVTEEGYLAVPATSKQKFQDHTLHVEFRTPFKPSARGQGRGNSGVYVQERYEVQVLDSFGLEGKNNECGGIYSIAEPDVNMCYPPLSWQTYDIDFTAARYDDSGKKTKNARVTVRHNGVVIHDDIELPHGTPGKAKEGPDPLGVYLQGHGNPVFFKNIWVVTKE